MIKFDLFWLYPSDLHFVVKFYSCLGLRCELSISTSSLGDRPPKTTCPAVTHYSSSYHTQSIDFL